MSFEGSSIDPHYLAYFHYFNRGLYFEAHEVLEQIWLPERGKPKDFFFKGLIQLAGAFVHVQKGRPQPALALLKLAASNLRQYNPFFEGLHVAALLREIEVLIRSLGSEPAATAELLPPHLELQRTGLS